MKNETWLPTQYADCSITRINGVEIVVANIGDGWAWALLDSEKHHNISSPFVWGTAWCGRREANEYHPDAVKFVCGRTYRYLSDLLVAAEKAIDAETDWLCSKA